MFPCFLYPGRAKRPGSGSRIASLGFRSLIHLLALPQIKFPNTFRLSVPVGWTRRLNYSSLKYVFILGPWPFCRNVFITSGSLFFHLNNRVRLSISAKEIFTDLTCLKWLQLFFARMLRLSQFGPMSWDPFPFQVYNRHFKIIWVFCPQKNDPSSWPNVWDQLLWIGNHDRAQVWTLGHKYPIVPCAYWRQTKTKNKKQHCISTSKSWKEGISFQSHEFTSMVSVNPNITKFAQIFTVKILILLSLSLITILIIITPYLLLWNMRFRQSLPIFVTFMYMKVQV